MTDPTITVRLSLDPTQRDALARISRAAQELTAAIDALSPEPAPRWASPRWAVDPDDPRRIIHASDATAAPEPSAAPDVGTGMGQGVSGPQNDAEEASDE